MITQRMLFKDGKLVDFAVMHRVCEAPSGYKPDVARSDCKHEEVHWHLFNFLGAELQRAVLRKIHAVEDVDGTYHEAYEKIVDDRNEHRRRWLSGAQ